MQCPRHAYFRAPRALLRLVAPEPGPYMLFYSSPDGGCRGFLRTLLLNCAPSKTSRGVEHRPTSRVRVGVSLIWTAVQGVFTL